jgi:hypothetical protein
LARRIALHQIDAGSVFVLVRRRDAWLNLVPELREQVVVHTAHPLAAHLSRGNLRDGWNVLMEAMRGAALAVGVENESQALQADLSTIGN